MTIEETIHSELTGDATVGALISSRAYPLKMPQNPTLPNVVYQLISGEQLHVSDYVDPRYQLACWAATYAKAVELADAVRALFAYRHMTVSGLHYRAMVQNEMDTDPDDETGYYRRIVDVKFLYVKPT